MKSRVCLLALWIVSWTAAAEPVRVGVLDSATRDALRPGWQLSFLAPDGTVRDARPMRLANLFVPADTPPSPFVPAGPFRATLSGFVKERLRAEHGLRLECRGTARLLVNGTAVLAVDSPERVGQAEASVSLAKGYNRLVIEFTSPPQGDARLRLLWSGEDFAWEPLPPGVLNHDGRDEAVQRGNRLRTGRWHVATQHCLKCHVVPLDDSLEPASRMPELAADAPSLVGVGARLEPAWIAAWLLAPETLRNKTTMPRLLDANDAVARQQAVDLAAYLATQQGPSRPAEQGAELRRGELLFDDCGCLSCHRFTPLHDPTDQHERLSLHFVGTKFRPGALAAFLGDTHAHYRWSRMPKFALSATEAGALATFVRQKSEGTLEAVTAERPGDARRGREAFATLGCANCHAVESPPLASRLPRRPIRQPAARLGCLADEGTRHLGPRFRFSDADREALVDWLNTDRTSLARDVPQEFAARQIAALDCVACHARDDRDPKLPLALLDEGTRGRPPELLPSLTWAGEKLRGDWVERLLAGQLAYRSRPHFATRMPAFPERAPWLAAGLSHQHGLAVDDDPRPPPDAALGRDGARVAAMDTGLACHRCHAIGDQQAAAPFESRSTNLSYASERLRYDYFRRWMLDPLRLEPNTKMLKFAPDGKTTPLTTYFGGDAAKQFDAVWHYLVQLGRDSGKRAE